MDSFTNLKAFRKRAYTLLGNGKDSVCDLMDAVLTSRGVPSFAELSLSPVFRRAWPSLYKMLERSQPPRQPLMELYVEHLPKSERVILAGDHTAWPRLWAHTLQERTYEHQPSPSPGSPPVTVGQGYSSLVCVPEMTGSWVLPLLHERITSFESPLTKAADQLKQVCDALDHRPLSMWDAEYGCARFIQLTAEIACDKLMRLRSNRVLYGPPPPYSGRGRPRKHGDKFKLNDPDTWWPPQHQSAIQDDTLGHLRLRGWTQLHFYKTAAVPMQLILVERLDATGQPTHRPLWLIATGEDIPDMETLWRLYLRRFCVDHWYRFIKQRLHWCLPQLSTPEQTAGWSDLMPLMSWQLWLARPAAQDHPLPWQKPLNNQTPGRVANAFASILVAVATPAQEPKPRGKSPGWPTGKKRTPKHRFPTVKKSYSKPKSQAQSTA
jgi:hypothetical protein